MTSSKRLHALTRLTEIQYRAAQSELAKLLRREAALRQNLSELTQKKSAIAQADRKPGDAALAAGADIRWHAWVDQRKATINTELAQVLAQKDGVRRKLARAFGRDKVAEALFRQAQSDHAQKVRRRADFDEA